MKPQFWILTALAALSLTGCSGKSSPTLVTVNGESVSNDQLYRYMAKKPTVRVQTASGTVEAQVAEPLDFQSLQDLIGQKVVLQLAKDEGVYPKDNDVIKELEFRRKLNPNYVNELTRNGINLEVIKENLQLELARESLLTKGITVTMDEAKKYVADNPTQFMDPARADLLWVFVKTEAKKADVEREVASGQAFDAIAIKLSDYPTAREQGARFPQQNIDQMPAQLKKMVEGTSEGKTTDWLKLDDGWAKFYVRTKTAAKKMELTDDRYELVRRSIARQRGEKATDLPKRVLDKIKASTINVSEPSLRDAWKVAFEKLQKEGAAAAPGAAGAGTGTGSEATGADAPAPDTKSGN